MHPALFSQDVRCLVYFWGTVLNLLQFVVILCLFMAHALFQPSLPLTCFVILLASLNYSTFPLHYNLISIENIVPLANP